MCKCLCLGWGRLPWPAEPGQSLIWQMTASHVQHANIIFYVERAKLQFAGDEFKKGNFFFLCSDKKTHSDLLHDQGWSTPVTEMHPPFLSTPAEYALPPPGEARPRVLLLRRPPLLLAGLQVGLQLFLTYTLMAFLFILYSCTVSERAKLWSGELRRKRTRCQWETEASSPREGQRCGTTDGAPASGHCRDRDSCHVLR